MSNVASSPPPSHVVVMGVAGSGKSTIASMIAQRLGSELGEGDDHHPQANVAKMSAGEALTDSDRWPWLGILAGWTRERHDKGISTVLTCSALRRAYRDLLRAGGSDTVTAFIHLTGDRAVLAERMSQRQHFMPDSLLDSQFTTLEHLDSDERGLTLDGAANPGDLVDKAVAYIAATQ